MTASVLPDWPSVSRFTVEPGPEDCSRIYRAVHDVEIDWSDQRGWFDPNKYTGGVTIIGVGGIGSNAAFELLTMGINRVVLYDDDSVEARNLASQKGYRVRDIYHAKVDALARLLLEFGATEVVVYQRRFTADDVFDTPLVIGAVDSMASRRIIWDAIAKSDVQLYVDGRLHKEIAQICTVEPFDADWYTQHWLFGDEEAAPDGDCTQRAIVYPATAMAAVMCRNIKLWLEGLPVVQFADFDLMNLEINKIGDIE